MVVGHNLSSGNFGCTEFHNEYYFVATKRLCCFKLRIIKTVNYCLQSCVLMRQERLSLWVYPTVITFVLFVLQDLLTDPFHPECGHHLCRQCRNLLLSTKKFECPTCRKSDALSYARYDNYLHRKVNSVKVHCQHHKEGCKWVGGGKVPPGPPKQ